MTTATADPYFVLNADGDFEPTPLAGRHWGESMISGPAVAGLAASATNLVVNLGTTGLVTALANPAARIGRWR